ncbi:MAG: 4'-phosphopantetheinyl transferase superfamily protein [Myxococcales bacterium]|nr:4'-phosphopantetheinyl transferase superfamily protein [Myxococcales bacterium]MBK7195120.1 4'-phosphopantetheinyl transferase superfamily protein [Myxococcales bacterium]MBP6848036.1 4'-phosphopantetheinyl transferase superfamily protein [Kofleriaceae bacterium]
MSLRALLPASCAVVEHAGGWPVAALHPDEARALGPVAEARRAEFAAGRACARAALAALGHAGAPVGRGDDRGPRWPAGVVGSITHCAGYVAAAVAPAAACRALGVDAEPNQPLPADVLTTVASATERRWLAATPPGAICWDRLLFSAKESVYKAWRPVVGTWLGFEDVELTVDPTAATFAAAIAAPGPFPHLAGRFAITPTIVITAIYVPAA